MTQARTIHRAVVDLLLSDMWQSGSDGSICSFLYGRPGAPHFERRLGAQVAFGRKGLVRAALLLRLKGPPHFRYLPIDDISRLLTDFICENYWYLSDDTFGKRFEECYGEIVRESAKQAIAEELAESAVLQPKNVLTLYPLVPVRIDVTFDSDVFFLIPAKSLNHDRLPAGIRDEWIVPDQFPPIATWDGVKHAPSAWLGISSPAIQASNKMKAIILGAIALTQPQRARHTFSMRQMFGGHCTLAENFSTTFDEPHTPGMADNIVLTSDDHSWLSSLAGKLVDNQKKIRRQLRALQYFYRAWPLDAPERFPALCMALDAIFGEANHATQAVIDGIRASLGEHVLNERLRLLMDLRAAVVHGGAPDVYDSSKYSLYFDRYEADPIIDLELVLVECLRKRIFDSSMREHADPWARELATRRAAGQWRQRSRAPSILDGN